MGDILSKIVALILAVFLLFIFPTMNMFENQDNISRILVFNETTKFVDSVRNLGYITPRMYEEYNKKISATGNIYSIKMEHMHLKIDPIYTDVNDLSTFQENANSNYDNFYNDDILKILFSNKDMEDRKYTLNNGDYFTLKVSNNKSTMGTKIKELLLNINLPEKNIVVNYGGMIKNETY